MLDIEMKQIVDVIDVKVVDVDDNGLTKRRWWTQKNAANVESDKSGYIIQRTQNMVNVEDVDHCGCRKF